MRERGWGADHSVWPEGQGSEESEQESIPFFFSVFLLLCFRQNRKCVAEQGNSSPSVLAWGLWWRLQGARWCWGDHGESGDWERNPMNLLYKLLGSPPSWTCVDLTLNSTPQDLRTEHRLDHDSAPRLSPLGGTHAGLIWIVVHFENNWYWNHTPQRQVGTYSQRMISCLLKKKKINISFWSYTRLRAS